MFRRFLFHKAIGDKGLLLILPKPSIYPRLLLGTFVGNVKSGLIRSRLTNVDPEQTHRETEVKIKKEPDGGVNKR